MLQTPLVEHNKQYRMNALPNSCLLNNGYTLGFHTQATCTIHYGVGLILFCMVHYRALVLLDVTWLNKLLTDILID